MVFAKGALARVVAVSFALSAAAAWSGIAEAQQVSEADRQAARELFQQGFQLQQAGNYADALEKFSRAQAVFSAPTNLLHIAECQAQLGQLVESAETYRGTMGLVLPLGSPPAFAAAQTQAKAELQQIEARIPKVRIEVTPANPPGLTVTIDDQPMNVALVGVDRPIDPGNHKIAAVAGGFGRLEASVVIKEKEPTKVISFRLTPNGSVLQPPPGAVQGYPPGQMVYTVPYGVPAVQPYGVPTERPYVPPPKKDYTSLGFFLGGRLGAAFPTSALATTASTGAGFDIEGYFRFAHKWFVGAYGGHDFYKATNGATTAGSNDLGGAIGFTTNPEGVGFMLDLTLGYRSYTGTVISTSTGGMTGGAGVEGGVGTGVWIAIGKHVRLVPRADVSAGELQGNNGYADIFAGVSLYYNLDLKPKTEFAAPPPAAATAPAPAAAPSAAP